MQVLTFPLGELQANCYILVQDGQCLLIDPGDSADFILEELSRRNLRLIGVLATHGHFDHVMAVGEIQLALGVPFYLASADTFLIDRLEETAKHFLGHTPVVIKPTKILDIGAVPQVVTDFQIDNFKLKIIATPGHTPGSVCIYSEGTGELFTGDTLFKDGIGRYDFSYANKKQLFASIEYLMRALPSDTLIYPGHGDPSTLGVEHHDHS